MSTLRTSRIRKPLQAPVQEGAAKEMKGILAALVPIVAYLGVIMVGIVLFCIAALRPHVQKADTYRTVAMSGLGFMLAAAFLGTPWLHCSWPTKVTVWVSLVATVSPLIAIGLLSYFDSVTFELALGFGTCACFTITQTLLKALKAWLFHSIPRRWAVLVWILYVAGVYILLLTVPTVFMLMTEEITEKTTSQVTVLCGTTFTLFLIGLWSIIQLSIFRRARGITLASALLVFFAYASCQAATCYLLLQRITEGFQLTKESAFLGVLYCFIPCFTLGGLSWTASQVSKESKQMVLVLLCGFLPLPILLPLYIGWSSSYQFTILYLILILPLTAVYWSLLSILYTVKPDLFKLGSGLSCVLVASPVGVLLPLSEMGLLPSTQTRLLVLSLLGLEITVITSVILYWVLRFCNLDKALKKQTVRSWNLYNAVLCLTMLLFMGAAGLLSWGIGQDPSSWGMGLLIAMLSALPILYILSVVLLKVKVAPDRSTHLTDVVNQLVQLEKDTGSMDLFTLRKQRIQQLSACGSCLGFLVLVIALSLQDELPTLMSTLLLSLSLTLLVFLIATIFLVQLKYKAASFAKVLMSSTISCCWLFIVLPFIVFIPLALSLSSEDSIGSIVSFAVALAGFLLILGISAFSIVFNLLLKKLEQEKQARAVTEDLLSILESRRVRIDPRHMRVIYDQYKILGKEDYIPKLLDESFFSMKELGDSFFTQEIQPSNQKEDVSSKTNSQTTPPSFWDCLGCFDYLYERTEEDELEDPSALDITLDQIPVKDRWILNGQVPEVGFDFEQIGEIQLNSRKRNALGRDAECRRLLQDKLAFDSWFYAMFRLFARKVDQAGQCMRLADVLQFFRLSGLRAVYFDEQAIQVYHSVRTLRGLTPSTFLRKFLPEIGNLSIWFPLERLVQEYIYPHLVTHLRAAGFRYLSDEDVAVPEDDEDSLQFCINEEDYYEEIYAVKCYSCVQKKLGKCVGCVTNLSSVAARLLFFCARVTSSQSAEKTRVVPQREVFEEEIKDWNEGVKLIIDGIELSEKERGLQAEESNVARLSGTNVLFVLSRILEFYSLSAIAFLKEVRWSSSESEVDLISNILLIETNIVVPAFWIAFGLSITFAVLSKWAWGRARRGLLGRAEDGSLAKRCSASFWLSRSITLLGSVFYMFIIKSFLNFVACRMEDGSWKMTRNDDMQCFEGIHILYVVAACLGLLAYYPVATLIYPNLQFQSVGLDFKFDSTYLVLVSQVKLIISGVATFIDYKTDIALQLVVSGIGIASLAVLSWWMQPCIVKPFNLWNGIGYACSAWNTVAGLTVYYTEVPTLGLFMIGAFYLVAIAFGLAIHIKKFGRLGSRRAQLERSATLVRTLSRKTV